MALPTFVAAGTYAASTGVVNPGAPAGRAAGDIELLFCESNSMQPISAPASGGWAQIPDSPQDVGGTGETCLAVFWRRLVTGAESAPTVPDSGNHNSAIILAFRGCIASGDPWDVTSGGTASSSTSLSATGDTTTVSDCLVVVGMTHGTSTTTPQLSGWANASLANVTERTDNANTSGGGGGIATATGEKATAGTYGATTATLATASFKAFVTIALRPPPGGATVTGAAALSITLAPSVSGFQTAHGSATLSTALSPAASGLQTAFGAAGLATTITPAADGLQTAYGAATLATTISLDADGDVTPGGGIVFGAASLALTITPSAAAAHTAYGAASLAVSFPLAASGFNTVYGAAALPVTIAPAVAAFNTAYGSAGLALLVSLATAGILPAEIVPAVAAMVDAGDTLSTATDTAPVSVSATESDGVSATVIDLSP